MSPSSIRVLTYLCLTYRPPARLVRRMHRWSAGCCMGGFGHISQLIPSNCPFPDSVRQRFGLETFHEHIFNFIVECLTFIVIFNVSPFFLSCDCKDSSASFHLANQQKFVVRIRLPPMILFGDMRPQSAQQECREKKPF